MLGNLLRTYLEYLLSLRLRFEEQVLRSLAELVGRLANEKRLEDLLILDQRDDIQLVIIGDGPARLKLERVLNNARFVGYQSGENLARYYASLEYLLEYHLVYL